MIRRLLIANRGEIARRIIETADRMGIETVALFTDPDAGTPHVTAATLKVYLSDEGSAGEPYLDIDRIIEVAQETGADAIHPGYGFLSENAAFAEACENAGITFVGPSAAAIRIMGDKAEGKRVMQTVGVPCVPGYDGADQDPDLLQREANKIGFPILIKAVAGGGGRGMRRVEDAAAFQAQLESARNEARNAFGSDAVILEKALDQVRHIEVQIFGDNTGTVLHLGERDCSSQRRNQKVIEEAPAPGMDAALREKIGAAAVKAASAIDYVGAGTVEFLMDQSGAFYFIEMNTRLQVEHPVTEEITGIDLVEWQLTIAAGKPLPLSQQEIGFQGAAIEARLYAEDPDLDFLPQTGLIAAWHVSEKPDLRIDHMITPGNRITARYDPMIAKVIAYGETRESARRLLLNSLRDLKLSGVKTNKMFLQRLIHSNPFCKGVVDTGFIARLLDTDNTTAEDWQLMLAAGLYYWLDARQWGTPRDFSTLGPVARRRTFIIDDVTRPYYLRAEPDRVFVADQIDGDRLEFQISERGSGLLAVTNGADAFDVAYWVDGATTLFDVGTCYVSVQQPNLVTSEAGADHSGHIIAPMAGKILDLTVAEGATVSAGDTVAILEAMKMEHRLTVEGDGVIGQINVTIGDQVNRGDLLIEIEAA